MAGYKPRQGWIYFINPYRVYLRCKLGHHHIYNLDEPGEISCKTTSCTQIINSSRVFRGEHPYIIWTSDKFPDDFNYIETFTLIPLTSSTRERDKGLPTAYPINATVKNGLNKQSFALVHQICTVDANCFKDAKGDWLNRIGQIDKSDKEAVEERLKYFLNIQENPSDDWFMRNASPELLKQVFDNLPEDSKQSALEELIDNLDF
ncbi:MAG: type II toxin-antitoxin system PemK/MazF family toxin [Cyanomargarita calcarea GSE-NOS-MK-12-04C]|uniref:Type II toxin-antitoxin system PemK/MazF family toxin n=1 Tax=Cyanomargarita calcarea GSE-NOS-MK-12-04C TaxID=2839659 RepID=A0A951UU58_9CYAN|nr:type II toxin-antitoxin system PemK/MazF family toxin [Cyanomargarita calcarea GSE-NOS-MK-12-04C]